MAGKQLHDYRDLLLDKKVVCTVAVTRKDNTPHLTPIWFGMNEENFKNKEITMNTLKGRLKANLFKKGTKIGISMMDPDQPSRYLSMDGEIRSITEGEEGTKHIQELSHKYTGHDADFLNQGDIRIKYTISINNIY